MLDFDFARYVREFRYRTWAIDNAGTRISKIFAMHFVLGLKKHKDVVRLSRRLNKVRKLWIWRLRELSINELWQPTKQKELSPYHPEFDLKKFKNAFRRCMFCRPACAHYRSIDGRQITIRPCWHTHICPFCWLNLTIAQYVYVKQGINQLVKQHDANFVAVCRVIRWFVPAPGFNPNRGTDGAQVKEHARVLEKVIAKQRHLYARLSESKKLQRQTKGSLWRLVVIPDEKGWHIEVRQFLVCRPNTPLPVVKIRGVKVTYLKSLKLSTPRLTFNNEFFYMFGEFCRYPATLLTDYCQLTAAYLHATHNVQLISGTGVFSKTGRVLMHYMRKRRTDDLARKAAKEAEAAVASGPPAHT